MKNAFDILFKHTHEDKKNPMHIVRYEDLVNKPRDTMLGLFSFLLEEDDLEGTNAMRRVEATVAAGTRATQSYELKNTTGKLNVNWDLYTEDQRQFIMDTLGDHLWYLGYAKHPSESNPTGFFEFKNPNEGQLSKHYQFERDNKLMREKLLSPDYKVQEYIINKDEAFDVLDAEDEAHVQDPARFNAHKVMDMKLIKAKKGQ